MEHRQIQCFLAVARTGSFSRAGEELHLATSSVSRQIKRLEDDLGAALFDRSDGTVRLTDAGHVLMPEAINLTEGIENARAAVQELTGPVEGRVAIITGEGWEVWPFWPEMVRQFRERHPGISTTVHQAPSTEVMLKAVASGEADTPSARTDGRDPTRGAARRDLGPGRDRAADRRARAGDDRGTTAVSRHR